jgi:glycosyltransferase involved in cell wall biosynthesis
VFQLGFGDGNWRNPLKLSVIMPVYNEQATVDTAIKRLLDTEFQCEIELVVVNDGSVDGTSQILADISDQRISLHEHPTNRGKGAAIKSAVANASGDYIIMYDADLEYYPEDIPSLLEPVLAGDATVVYGTRAFRSHTAYSFWYVLGNKSVTMFANVLYDSWISDLETCFKLMPIELYRSLRVNSLGFGVEAEITGKLLKRGIRPYEVPINYKARSREEGKKLTWQDGVEALWILTKIRFGRS